MALDEAGKEYTSLKFAARLEELGSREIVFVIGGTLGLAAAIKQKVDEVVSLSQMTFTHQMVRVFLLEQIYRAVTIIQGKRYHY